MSGTLSPSEIQSLFGGLDLSPGARDFPGSGHTSIHTITSSDQFTLPLSLAEDERAALQAGQAAFAERWLRTWSDPLRQRLTLADTSVTAIRLRDFITVHAGWKAFQSTSINPQRTVWFALDDCLIASHLDCSLGVAASDMPALAPRPWGPVETQLTSRMLQGICESLFATEPGTGGSEWQVTSLNSPDDWISGAPIYLLSELAQFEFEFTCLGSTGRLHLGIPRPICRLALAANKAPEVWMSLPANGETQEFVEIRARLAPIRITDSEFQDLQIGDVLLTGHDSQAECHVAIGGELRYQATIGSHASHKAIRLMEFPSQVQGTSDDR